jgi:integrase
MKTRTASLQVAHQKTCPMAGKAGLDSLDDCTCKPSYFTFYRDSRGKIVRGDDGTGNIVGRTRRRRDAERWLTRLQDRLEQDLADPERRKTIRFRAWVAEYQAGLAKRVARGKLKARTERGYADTLVRAVATIGEVDLREIGSTELQRFTDDYGEKASDATLARALRELGACLSEAVDAGYLERNPVRTFVKKAELDSRGRGRDAFTDLELSKLWAALAARTANGAAAKGAADPVYLYLCRAAVATGARLGELIALDWDEVSLSERAVKIRHTYNPVDGLTPPKTKGSVRTIHLTPAAVKEFEAIAATGSVGPVFVGRDGERLNGAYLDRVLTRAREAAGIPKLGESGLPRSFHSFRSTFDRRMLEQGRHPEWVRRQLGHASLELTLNHYGAWSDAAMQAEAAQATDEL